MYFFSTRQQIDQKWGTPQPITIRDADFGAVRLRAFGNYAYRVADPKRFHTEISGTRASTRPATSTVAARPGAAKHQHRHCQQRRAFSGFGRQPDGVCRCAGKELRPAFEVLGLQLENLTVQNLSLPEELQKILDQKSAWAWWATTWQVHAVPNRQAIPKLAEGVGQGGGGVVGDAMAWAQAWPWVRCWRKTRSRPGAARPGAASRGGCGTCTAAAAPVGISPDEVMSTWKSLPTSRPRYPDAGRVRQQKAELLKKLI